MNDSDSARDQQYKTSDNLSARADVFKRFGSGGTSWHAWVFDHLLAADLPGDARIADIGGGPGWLWQQNEARIPPGWRVSHTDLSPGMVTEARANITRSGSSFEVADAQELPFADASLDALVANHMLYHVRDRKRAYREFARVLKPRGRLFATTNGEKNMGEISVLIEAFNRTHGDLLPEWPKLNFTLESGKPELDMYFERVELHRSEGMLRVTEAEPLAACILSIGSSDEATRTKLVEHLQATIAVQRILPIHTESGIFVARK